MQAWQSHAQIFRGYVRSLKSGEMQTVDYKKQVDKQIALGFALIAVLSAVLWLLIPDQIPASRVEYTLSWLAVFSVPLFLGIHLVLFRRHGDADLIKGYAGTADLPFERAYLSNTMEQTAVNSLTAVTLGMVVPMGLIKLVPIQATIYTIGRILYYIAYRSSPMKRFTGFVAGYYVAVGSLLLSTYFTIVNHL